MAAPKQIIFGGLSYGHIGKLVSGTYYPGGIDGAITAGQGEGLYRLKALKTAALNIPEAVRQTQTGDDQAQGTMLWSSTEDLNGSMNVGILDLDYESMAQGTVVVALGDGQWAAINPKDQVFVDHLFLLSRPAKSKAALTSGQSQYLNYLIPLMNAAPRGDSGITEREFADVVFDIIGNKTGTMPWGETVEDFGLGTTEAAGFRVISKFPLMIDVFRGNNAATTFTLSKIPAGDHSSDYLDVFTYADGNDASGDMTSISTSTGLVTFSAAPGTDEIYVFVYQWDPSANA